MNSKKYNQPYCKNMVDIASRKNIFNPQLSEEDQLFLNKKN